jgi:prepilin-type N-terminal cleavage/methylation domain-containing protein
MPPVKKCLILDNKGFTLIELIAVLVIMSVVFSVGYSKITSIDMTAREQALDLGVFEMNNRETLTWAMVKISNTGYINDQQVWDRLIVDPGINLGSNYTWTAGPSVDSGTLSFKSETSSALQRNRSTIQTPGLWKRL